MVGCGGDSRQDGPESVPEGPEGAETAAADRPAVSAERMRSQLRSRLDTYERSNEALEALLDASNRPESIRVAARDLVDQAELMLDAFARLDPGCAEYLSEVRGLTDRLDSMSAETFDADYLEGAALPEGGAACRAMKGLLAAPAGILVRLRESELSAVRADLLNVVRESGEHLRRVRGFLGGGPAPGGGGTEN